MLPAMKHNNQSRQIEIEELSDSPRFGQSESLWLNSLSGVSTTGDCLQSPLGGFPASQNRIGELSFCFASPVQLL